MKRIIGLLTIGDVPLNILVKLRKKLDKSFKGFDLSIKIIQKTIPLEKVEYDLKRRQYNASKVLTKITSYFQKKMD